MNFQPVPQPSKEMEDLTSEVEKKLFACLVEHIKKSELTVGQAQDMAKEFTALLPAHNKEGLVHILQEVGKHFSPAQEVYLSYARDDAQQQREQRLSQVGPLIQSGNINGALEILHRKE